MILEQFPQVKYAIQNHCKVDFRALAQHYDLNTNLIDVTIDIAITAFFATHYYDSKKNEYSIEEDGTGCLRVYSNIMIEYKEDQPFRMIGLQPFQRPGLQCAFEVKMSRGENLANFYHKVLFKQSSKWNQKLHDPFYLNGKNILFSDEEIADVAKIIKESMAVSKWATERYCDINGISENQVIHLLNDKGFTVVENLNYKLSR